MEQLSQEVKEEKSKLDSLRQFVAEKKKNEEDRKNNEGNWTAHFDNIEPMELNEEDAEMHEGLMKLANQDTISQEELNVFNKRFNEYRGEIIDNEKDNTQNRSRAHFAAYLANAAVPVYGRVEND